MDIDENNIEERKLLIDSYLEQYGFVRHHIESFNYFLNVKLNEIIRSELNKELRIEADKDFFLEYEKIKVGLPCYDDEQPLLPQDCRLSNNTYAANIKVDVKFSYGGEVERAKDILIGQLPIMVGSDRCYLNKEIQKEKFLKNIEINECPYDPQGYFIIKGVEKVFLIQEQIAENRIIIEEDKDKELMAKVICSTVDTITILKLIQKNKKIYVSASSFKGPIPLLIFFKAYGIESEQEIFQMITNKIHLLNKLSLCLEDIETTKVYTKEQARHYLASQLKPKQFIPKVQRNPVDEVMDYLSNVYFCHIPCKNFNYFPRAFYLALMTKRLLDAVDNQDKVDQKDYYGNKRMKCAGWYLELLFEDKFKIFNLVVKKDLMKEINSMKKGKLNRYEPIRNRVEICLSRNSDVITRAMTNAISTGVWKISRYHVDAIGVTQVLARMTYIGALGMMQRLNSQFNKTLKLTGPRSLIGSSWGLVCPSDTPDGESCGLTKNLALLAHITTQKGSYILTQIATQLGMEDIGHFVSGEIHDDTNFMVFLNGQVIGLVRDPSCFVKELKILRRRGKIGDTISIFLNESRRSVFLDTDYGRLSRPLIIVENMKPKLKRQHIQMIQNKQKSFSDLIGMGIIEYIDVNEEDNSLIAMKVQNITKETTHLEIDPMTILGVVVGVIPFPHHNQSSRNTFQCAMGKQALGIISSNSMSRVDTINYQLLYPQRPLLKTKQIELTAYDKFPAGHNASLAVLSFSGYDIEDAIVINKASLDRGFGRVLLYRKHETILKNYSNIGIQGCSDQIEHPPLETEGRPFLKKYEGLDYADGVSRIGVTLKSGDIMVNRITPVIPTNVTRKNALSAKIESWRNEPTTYKAKGHNTSRVDRVILSSIDGKSRNYKTMTREFRRPELGDKFSSRHGQKGVVGLIVNQEDFPFSEQGWCPDLIMNPHGYPSRMTVGKLLELLGSKAGICQGKFRDGTSFAGDKMQTLSKILVENGFSYTGKDVLISGITGEYMQCYVYCGPVFYQRLKHMVADKVHARARGAVTTLTRQPTQGRAKAGGGRLGEMERDCLLSYASSNLLMERLMISSDIYQIYVCEICGFMKHSNNCSVCKVGEDKVHKIVLPYACKLLFQELISMNIKPKLKIVDCKIKLQKKQ